MYEYRPLYKPLEFRINVGRVCRSMGFVLSGDEYQLAKKETKKLYKEITGNSPDQIDGWISYPAEFIPVIKNIARKYKDQQTTDTG